jgi:asparagine synthase (glutamine-hydrolysing)
MCGFAGYLTSSEGDEKSFSENLTLMTDKIIHRGPNDVGCWFDLRHGIGLGHRRLSIVDLSPAGHQPMVSPSGRYIIAFNGEIYNHLDLRNRLQVKTSFSWRGRSDTETLLACFDAWGVRETVDAALGMFAFAVWDSEDCCLILGRDRLGEKPLYYGWQGDCPNSVFLFGSELKSIKGHPTFKAGIDRGALALYMRHNNVPAPYSIYEGIRKLMPGTLMTVSLDSPEPKYETYWSGVATALSGVGHPYSGSPASAVESLDGLLKRAIDRQMVADVPLGAFLSGGVDSSTVVALMQAQSSRPVKTFSIGFNEAEYDEAVYAKDVASYLGTDHTELYVSPEKAMSVIPKLPVIYDEPFADSSQIPTFLVSEMARQHVTVSLSGDAGDELFSGYNRYQMTANTWSRIGKWPSPVRAAIAAGILKISPNMWNELIGRTPLANRWAGIGYKLHKAASVIGAAATSDLYNGLVSQWTCPEDVVLGAQEPSTLLTGGKPDLIGLNDVEQMMVLDMLTYLPDDILTKVDRAAMSVSLETRVPFLDREVVEFAWSLPIEYKLRQESSGYTTKWALREVLYRYVPKELIERPKMGFGVPIDSWLRGPLRGWAENLLDEGRLIREGYLNPAPIRQRWHEHLSGQRDWQHSLWCVLMFQAWLEGQGMSD